MKWKIGLILLVGIVLFVIVGCNNVKFKDNENSNFWVKVNGIELYLDKEKEFRGIKYATTDNLLETSYDQYVQYNLYKDSESILLFFRIFYYEDKTHNDIRYDLAIESSLTEEIGKTDNIEYTFIDMKRSDGTIHYYIIDKNDVSYVINFVSQYDIKDFEKKVVDSIKF